MLGVAWLTACGDIREVLVADDGSTVGASGSSTDVTSPSTGSTADAVDTGETTADHDTEGAATETGKSPPSPPAPDMVCMTDPVAFDETGLAEVVLDVVGIGVVTDFDVGVRLHHEQLDAVEITLGRDALQWQLMSAGHGGACGGNLQAFFDTEGADLTDLCTDASRQDGSFRVRPTQDFGAVLDDAVDGTWTVRVTAPPSDTADVETVCLVMQPAG